MTSPALWTPTSGTAQVAEGSTFAIERLVTFFWRDRDTNGGETRFRLSRSLSLPSDLVAMTSGARLLLSAVSDMSITAQNVMEKGTELDPGDPGDTLVSRRVLVMWINTDDDYASMVIPAVPDVFFDEDGPMAGIHVDASVFEDWSDWLASIDAVDRQGIPINGVCLGGMLIV